MKSTWQLSDKHRVFAEWDRCPSINEVAQKLEHICSKLVFEPLVDTRYGGYSITFLDGDQIAVLTYVKSGG